MLIMSGHDCKWLYSLLWGLQCQTGLEADIFPLLRSTNCMCSSGNQGDGGILAVAFESPDSLLLARGSAVKPVFERVKVPKGSSSKAAQIQLSRITVRLCPPMYSCPVFSHHITCCLVIKSEL